MHYLGILFLALFTGMLGFSPAKAASPFQTPEYYGTNTKAYDAINLAKAYELGFTGKGIILGIQDDPVYFNHREFLNKQYSFLVEPGATINWLKDDHGTHVAGSMAAAKDGLGMHGVSYDARLASYGDVKNPAAGLRSFLAMPEVRIINHSWNYDYFLEEYPNWDGMETLRPEINSAFIALGLANKVNVIAAGNEGHLGPGLLIQSSLKNPSITGTMVSVIAADPLKNLNAINMPAIFTNMAFGGAQDVSIVAPGVGIYSAKAGTTNEYLPMGGTSMASPIVTGTLGLVQQAFPYMTNKQLTSTLFSTATKFETAPYVVVMRVDEYDLPNGDTSAKLSVNLVYFKNTGHTPNAVADLTAYYNLNAKKLADYGAPTLADFLNMDRHVTNNATFADAFGHGYLNAGAAVQGPGYFKASWLDPRSDVRPIAVNGDTKEWQFTIDTQGYSSVFANDISQIKYAAADGVVPGTSIPLGQVTEFNKYQLEYYGFANAADAKNQLGTLDIGLTKRGDGVLFLTGNNTYEGHTVIEGGAIALSTGSTKQGSIKNAWVQQHGVLMGNGTVREKLFNDGIIAPGLSIGTITTKDFTQRAGGVLLMEFDQTGKADQLVVTGGANLAGRMQLSPLVGYWKSGDTTLNNSLLAISGASTGALEFSTLFSPTLNLTANLNAQYEGVLTVNRPGNAYSQHATNKSAHNVGQALTPIAEQAYGDMQNLITALDFSPMDGSSVRSGLNQLSPTAYGYSAQASAEANLTLGRMALGQLRTLTQGTQGAPVAMAAAQHAAYGEQGLAAGSAAANQSQWSAFVAPFASTSSQQAYDGMPGYNSSQAGLMGGVYTKRGALSLGMYTAFARRQMDAWMTAKSQMRGTSLHLGGMATWQPEPTGWHAFAQMQLGVENIDARRDVQISSYLRQNEAFSTAFSGTAMLGTGWQWQVDSLTFGPYVGLEYALNMQPQMQEWGGQATRLNMDAFNRHDLRGVAGVNLAWTSALGDAKEGRQMKASLDAAWRQDLLNTEYTMRSSFVGYGNQGFDTLIERQGQGSLGIMGSLQMDVRKDVTLGAHVQTEVLRQGYNSLGGGLTLRWEF